MVDAALIWNTKRPVILRREGPLRARLPYDDRNYFWLRNEARHKPRWEPDGQYWELPRSWFSNLVDRTLIRFGEVWIIQPYREQEKCAPACMNAIGHECQCSCMGQNHGMGNDGSWFEVSETFAVRWGARTLAARHLKTVAGRVLAEALTREDADD